MSMLDRKERILNLLEANPEDDFLLYALAKEFENGKANISAKVMKIIMMIKMPAQLFTNNK